MPARCAVAGCSNTNKDGVAVHKFPKESNLKAKWARFVRLTRADFTHPTRYQAVCEAHFTSDCYDQKYKIKQTFGLSEKCKRLLPGSVPSIYPKITKDSLATCKPPSKKRKTSASHKRDILMMIQNENGSSNSSISDCDNPSLEEQTGSTTSFLDISEDKTTLLQGNIKYETSGDESKHANLTDNDKGGESEQAMETDNDEADRNVKNELEEGPGTPLEDENSPPPPLIHENEVPKSKAKNPNSPEDESPGQVESIKQEPTEDGNSRDITSEVRENTSTPVPKQEGSGDGDSSHVTPDGRDDQSSQEPKHREGGGTIKVEDGKAPPELRETTKDVLDGKKPPAPESRETTVDRPDDKTPPAAELPQSTMDIQDSNSSSAPESRETTVDVQGGKQSPVAESSKVTIQADKSSPAPAEDTESEEREKEATLTNEDASQETKEDVPESSAISDRAESNSPAPMDISNPEDKRNTDNTESLVPMETENETRDDEKSSESIADVQSSKLDNKDDEDSKTSLGDNSTEETADSKDQQMNDENIEMNEAEKQNDEDVLSRMDEEMSEENQEGNRNNTSEDKDGETDDRKTLIAEDKNDGVNVSNTQEEKGDEDGSGKSKTPEDKDMPEDKDDESWIGDKDGESQDKKEQIEDKSENKEEEGIEKEKEDVRKSEDTGKGEMEKTDEPTEDEKSAEDQTEKQSKTDKSLQQEDDDDDVKIITEEKKVEEVVNLIDDDDDDDSAASKSGQSAIVDNTNEMGLQISSVTSGATMPPDDKPVLPAKVKTEPTSKSGKPKRPQVCIVCSKTCKCKFNIVRNGDTKHLCDDNCFKKFRSNPSKYLKTKPVEAKSPSPSPNGSPNTRGKQNLKTCHVCQLININASKPFCNWQGLDFCDEGCLQKFQNNLSASCAVCKKGIPKSNRGLFAFKISTTDVRSFCSSKCMLELKIRLCSSCKQDLSEFSSTVKAHLGPSKTPHEFCSKDCLLTYEKDQSNADVEILAIKPGTINTPSACSVCNKNGVPAHTVKLNNVVNKLCSSTCLQAFQYANSLGLNKCENCGKVCSSEEAKSFFIQFEGNQKKFCSDKCVENFRNTNQKVIPCAWCSSKKRNFDMIERVDSNNKYQLFCTLNCLSLYRVNLQAKSNLCVSCDHCRKYTPAQYHLTMSDASVRNFCSYNCVMAFQRQFTSGMTSSITPNSNNAAGSAPKQTRAAATKPTPPPPQVTTSSIPIISNVVSLAPPGQKQQTVNIKTNTQVPVVLGSPKTPSVISTGTSSSQTVQQQIIVQPPQPKVMKNKSLLCKPFVQTKATSCRPNVQNKKVGTEEEKKEPVIIPVPVPVYLPTPLAMYSNPTPIFYPVPVPIPVPIFIPTTKKSADKILRHIKEIQDKIPTDPLEAELLMMAEAVAGEKESSDSDSDGEKDDELPPAFMEDLDDKTPAINKAKEGEEDMLQMALRVAEEISEPIMDLEANVEPVAVKTDPPKPPAYLEEEEETYIPQPTKSRRGNKRSSRGRSSSTRSKRQKMEEPEVQKPPPALLTPVQPPEDANSYLKFTYGVNAWKHWVVFKNSQLEKVSKVGSGKLKLFKTDLLQCTADELNYSLCLFCKEVRKPNGEEYSPDSIYYLCLGIQQYLYENGRVDNIFNDFYYEKFAECLSEVLSNHQPKHNAAGQMLCRIEEEHLWEAKQLGAHSPYVLLNTLIYFHTKYFMMKTPQEHMNMSFTQILKHWRKGGPGKPTTNTAGRSVTLRYYCMGPGGAQSKNKSKEGIPVYETSENLENPLRCPVKLYEFYLSKCPESIKNVNDMFYLVPERSCVPDSPVWYSTQPLAADLMTKMLHRILLVREIQEAHLHAQPIYV